MRGATEFSFEELRAERFNQQQLDGAFTDTFIAITTCLMLTEAVTEAFADLGTTTHCRPTEKLQRLAELKEQLTMELEEKKKLVLLRRSQTQVWRRRSSALTCVM